ncbi:ATP-binding cassette domain-containing protein [Embleya sp. NPDC050154]|uniref:ATP-binding cassette domain-containing protein n=1 Tax=Embleya sp. NPDC050154 TaxID=3363988 RepID=UPI0037AEF773
MAMIQARALTKRYGGIVAVDDLSFDVLPGRVTALLGPNGAGKSTALRLMLDLERGGGETRYDGRRYRGLRRPGTEVGACVGAGGAHPGRRVRAHLAMLASAGRIPSRRVDEVLDLVGLTPVAGARTRVLSAGALGRLALASALLGDPGTLILDEPATGLDPQGLRWLRDFLRAYAAEGRTVLVAGHILAETARCADRVLVISRGRLVADESATDFLRRGVREGVSVRTPQVARLSALLRAEGVHTTRPGGTTLTVLGADRARVGEIAFRGGILLHELAEREPGVGDAFIDVITKRRERVRTDADADVDGAGVEPPVETVSADRPTEELAVPGADPTRVAGVNPATTTATVLLEPLTRPDPPPLVDGRVDLEAEPGSPRPGPTQPGPTQPGPTQPSPAEPHPALPGHPEPRPTRQAQAAAPAEPRRADPRAYAAPEAGPGAACAASTEPHQGLDRGFAQEADHDIDRRADPQAAPDGAAHSRRMDTIADGVGAGGGVGAGVGIEPDSGEPAAALPPRRRFARTWRSAGRAEQTDEVRSA